jgi:hypothetical protein
MMPLALAEPACCSKHLAESPETGETLTACWTSAPRADSQQTPQTARRSESPSCERPFSPTSARSLSTASTRAPSPVGAIATPRRQSPAGARPGRVQRRRSTSPAPDRSALRLTIASAQREARRSRLVTGLRWPRFTGVGRGRPLLLCRPSSDEVGAAASLGRRPGAEARAPAGPANDAPGDS